MVLVQICDIQRDSNWITARVPTGLKKRDIKNTLILIKIQGYATFDIPEENKIRVPPEVKPEVSFNFTILSF